MATDSSAPDAERRRLAEADAGAVPWRRWGQYPSERQWGTVREDHSDDGDAWSYFTHDQARSRAYRRGEDGIAGVSDDKQRLRFALALWNGRDPLLKERLFGLTDAEGHHGEDVKEYYFHLDNTPTHSYMRYLYKYPQAEFPYGDLLTTNQARGREDPIFGSPNSTPYVKDGIGDSTRIRLRLTETELADTWGEFEATMQMRRTEADTFYAGITPRTTGEEEKAPRPPGPRRNALEQAVLLPRREEDWHRGGRESLRPPGDREEHLS